jgi:hypothetical protein
MLTHNRQRHLDAFARRAVLATAAIATVAAAAPATQASAATPRTDPQASAAPAGSAVGPTLIGDTFNGATAIVTSPSPVSSTVTGAR